MVLLLFLLWAAQEAERGNVVINLCRTSWRHGNQGAASGSGAAIGSDMGQGGMEADHIAAFLNGMKILPVKNVADAVDVAAEGTTGETQGIKIAFPGMFVGGIVDRIVGNSGGDSAGDDALEGAGTRDATELNVFEKETRRVVERSNAGAREPIGDAYPGEGKPLHRIAGNEGEAGAVLIVILNELRIDADGSSGQERLLLSLIEFVSTGENREAGGNRAIEEVRLGETEAHVALKAPHLRGKRKRLAQPQEIVRGVGTADERSGDAADAAVEADGLFAFFMQLELDVHRSSLHVAFQLRVFWLDGIEIIQLVQPQ